MAKFCDVNRCIMVNFSGNSMMLLFIGFPVFARRGTGPFFEEFGEIRGVIGKGERNVSDRQVGISQQLPGFVNDPGIIEMAGMMSQDLLNGICKVLVRYCQCPGNMVEFHELHYPATGNILNMAVYEFKVQPGNLLASFGISASPLFHC